MHAHRTRFRVRRLAQCVAALLALSPALATSATWTVNSCSEAVSGSGKTGTLRYAVAHAASGDVVDMSHLSCSTISLHTGAIHIAQDTLTLEGKRNTRLTLTGKYNGDIEHDRILEHTGNGTLYIEHMNVEFGYLKPASGGADGGCIYSKGNVSMFDVGGYYCKATVTGKADVFGGAVSTLGSLTIQYGTFYGNIADASSGGGFSFGGAVSANGTFSAYYSTIRDNRALGAAFAGTDGAVSARGNVFVRASTISNNFSSGSVGGIGISSSSPGNYKATITNSTISGNYAAQYTGGLFADAGKIYLDNSTIAFNTAGTQLSTANPPAVTYYAAGVSLGDAGGPVAVDMQSTLIANNTVGSGTPTNSDFSIPATTSRITVTGANNLVRTHVPSALNFLPAKTLENVCPLLAPLHNNGGLTETHALLSHSPGLDQGNNAADLAEDQRGTLADFPPPYPYARVSGSAADIGAYEVQQDDIIFNAAFDGCPAL